MTALLDYDRYHRPSLVTEAQLLGVPLLRTESCACGGEITAPDSPTAILAAVQTHNATITHRAWRFTLPLSDPTVAPGAVDVSNVPAMRPAGERRR